MIRLHSLGSWATVSTAMMTPAFSSLLWNRYSVMGSFLPRKAGSAMTKR